MDVERITIPADDRWYYVPSTISHGRVEGRPMRIICRFVHRCRSCLSLSKLDLLGELLTNEARFSKTVRLEARWNFSFLELFLFAVLNFTSIVQYEVIRTIINNCQITWLGRINKKPLHSFLNHLFNLTSLNINSKTIHLQDSQHTVFEQFSKIIHLCKFD